MTHTPPIPAAFQDVLVDLPELTFSGEGTRFHQCFGCGPTHEIGLRVRCFRAAGEVLSPIVVPRRYEGPPGAVHGGIVAAYSTRSSRARPCTTPAASTSPANCRCAT